MLNNEIQTRLADAILDYLAEEGDNKITIVEAVGILELCKLQMVSDHTESE